MVNHSGEDGADVSCLLNNLKETAKRQVLNPHDYPAYMLMQATSLMPWSVKQEDLEIIINEMSRYAQAMRPIDNDRFLIFIRLQSTHPTIRPQSYRAEECQINALFV
ncbi:hypothetical protein SDC9_97922 [bioreactor metagenome]|uniref:Uncharacterized protein n=1 Tax=bioreactor metagenome TaxID=1076179 RepID=A0A645AD94_9ZZZZ